MSFSWGLMMSIDPAKTLIAFLVVIVFIIMFDYTTEILEFFLKDSVIYSKMVQAIYKELMIMGFLVFIVLLIETTHENATTELEQSLVAVDFAHVLIFFYSLFWVGYAFYLIRISVYYSKMNRMYVKLKPSEIIEMLTHLEENPLNNWFTMISRWRFGWNFVPWSNKRNICEFHITRQIFRALYLVPKEFDFTSYLSGCFKRYSLKTVNRSLMSWLFFFCLVLCNYFRLLAGFGCTIHTSSESSSSGHRYLSTMGSQGVEDLASSGSSHHESSSATSHHTSSTAEEANFASEDRTCTIETIRYFFLAGALCSLYAIILVVISSLYRSRLMHWVCSNGPKEYKQFFECIFTHFGDSEMETDEHFHRHRFPKDVLLHEIREEQKTEEYEEEDEEVIKFLAKTITKAMNVVSEAMLRARMAIKVRVSGAVWRRDSISSSKKPKGPSRIKRANSSKSMTTGNNNKAANNNSLHTKNNNNNNSHGDSSNHHILDRLTHHFCLQIPDEPPTLDTLKKRSDHKLSALGRDRMMKVHMVSSMSNDMTVVSVSGIQLTMRSNDDYDNDDKERQKENDDRDRQRLFAALSPAAEVACPVRFYLTELKQQQQMDGIVSCSPKSIFGLFNQPRKSSLLDMDPDNATNSRQVVKELYNNLFLFRSPDDVLTSFWITNMVTIVQNLSDQHFYDWHIVTQLGMIIPILVFIRVMPFITETASLLVAISDPDINVIRDVLESSIEAELLMKDLREKMVDVIEFLEAEEEQDRQQAAGAVNNADESTDSNGIISPICTRKESILEDLFNEIDADGSGKIDSDEFRTLLRHMKLTYSNRKFRLLFRAIDGIDGSGTIDIDELTSFVYPDIEDLRAKGHYISKKDQRNSKGEGKDIESQAPCFTHQLCAQK